MKRSPAPSVDPCCFYTSTTDQVYYYFLAILSTTIELKPVYAEYLELIRGHKSTEELETRLLGSLKVDRDVLITYQLDKARIWYQTGPEDAWILGRRQPHLHHPEQKGSQRQIRL